MQSGRSPRWGLVLFAVGVLVGAPFPGGGAGYPPFSMTGLARAQDEDEDAEADAEAEAPDDDADEPAEAGIEAEFQDVFSQPDRATLQRLTQSKKLLANERYGEAVRLLGDLVEQPEDFFFQPKRDEPIFRSLKSEAQRLLGSLPDDGRESYELQFGARAKAALEEAVRDGDTAKVAEVSRRFFHTRAGYEATYVLGSSEMAHGRPLAAALALARIEQNPRARDRFEPALSTRLAVCWMRAGLPDKAVATLSSLHKRQPDSRVVVAGRKQAVLQSQAQMLAWLSTVSAPPSAGPESGTEQWSLYRGSPARNAVSQGSSPLLNRRWAATGNDPYVETVLAKTRQRYLDQGLPLVPSLHPLAADGYVFLRSVTGLEAVDFRTGKRVWNGPVEESVRQLLEPGPQPSQMQGESGLTVWLEQRVWDNATYGTLSSDGDYVYCVEDMGLDLAVPSGPQIVLNNGRLMQQGGTPEAYNRLAAYEIATEGKLAWDLGAQPGETAGPLAGAYFLGPPLPLAGRLYVLAEIKDEVSLLCLDARNGTLDWSQQLVSLEQGAHDESLRRMSGLSPSYSDGILVCPTSAGAVVAVDLTTRSLLWGYRYALDQDPLMQHRMFALRMGAQPLDEEGQRDRWTDASVTIVGGHVLLTPPESENLHCLNLLEGKLAWLAPRDDGLYLACVHDGNVVVVGRQGLRAFNLKDGTPAWPSEVVTLPPESVPSGRGFYNGQRYFLPLSSAEVAAIDLADGRIVARAHSRSGNIPGNLICYRGAVVSQGLDVVESFYQIDDLRKQVALALERRPDDPEALARQGELLLNEGNLDEAARLLKKSFELADDAHTRDLLVEALLESLRVDFAAQRDRLDETETLADRPDQRATFLRLLAAGREAEGDLILAFEALLRLSSLEQGTPPLDRIAGNVSVRRDRWLQARLADLRMKASPEVGARIDAMTQSRVQAALQAPDTSALADLVRNFGSLPTADVAREALAERLAAANDLLAAEQLLLRLERSADPVRHRAAVARMAQLLARAGRTDEIGIYETKLTSELADQVCLDGKTGKQIAAELQTANSGSAYRGAPDSWPKGAVEVTEQTGQPLATYRNFGLEFRGSQQPFFARATVEVDQQQQFLIGRDGLARERWRVPLRSQNEFNNFAFNPTVNYARCNGHFLLISMGYELLGIDTLGVPGREGARVLWRQDLSEWSGSGLARNQGVHGRAVQMPWGIARFRASDTAGRAVGETAPLTGEIVVFQRARNLTVIDSISGETLWIRHDIEPGSDLFGDGTLLFVTPPDSTQAIVLRLLDGQELGEREVPPLEQRIVTLGRRVLWWSSDGAGATLKLTDVFDSTDLWTRPFALAAKVCPLGEEAVGILDREGRFALVNLPDGSLAVDAQVEPEPNLSELYLFRTATHDLLVSNRPWRNRRGVNVTPVPPPPGATVINGHVHGFSRETGALEFSTRVENQGLSFQQPADLPVLVFASNVYDQVRQGRGQSPHGNIMCVDKRTGRVVYQKELSGPITAAEVGCDPAEHTVVLRTLRSLIRLKFTDQPIQDVPVNTENQEGAKGSTSSKVGRALLRGFRKWIDERSPFEGEGDVEEDFDPEMFIEGEAGDDEAVDDAADDESDDESDDGDAPSDDADDDAPEDIGDDDEMDDLDIDDLDIDLDGNEDGEP